VITLGFNYSQIHDSSACIARDGELLYAVAEERISRIKHDAKTPENSENSGTDENSGTGTCEEIEPFR